MIRYALITLCSGATERLWWWRLAHPGFGLIDNKEGWRERPGWKALLQFHRTVGQTRFEKLENKDGVYWWHFSDCIVAYSLNKETAVLPPVGHIAYDLVGHAVKERNDQSIVLSESPIYFTRT
jgi:hypothetical protein